METLNHNGTTSRTNTGRTVAICDCGWMSEAFHPNVSKSGAVLHDQTEAEGKAMDAHRTHARGA